MNFFETAKRKLKKIALEQGAALCGVAPPFLPEEKAHFMEALESKRLECLPWISREPERRWNLQSFRRGTKSVVVMAFAYGERGILGGEGEVFEEDARAFYARGAEYHDFIREKMQNIWKTFQSEVECASDFCQICVDTSPLLEKALAVAAGLGWIGKNGLLVNENWGSFLLLGEMVTSLDLPPDEPAPARCGECQICLEACPTKAFASPYKLQVSQCLSYWTTLSKTPLPDDILSYLPAGMYGCDLCQKGCPYNQLRESKSC